MISPVKPRPAEGKGVDRSPGTGTATTLRVLLYSHDSWGLGHLRRSLAIAGAMHRCNKRADVLVITGSPCATQFDLPEHCDVLKLPAVSKDADGQYVSRSLAGSLSKTIELRRRIITEAYHSFQPHIVIVDHQLTGLLGEALPMLREARADGRSLVYGMRDVLDSPAVVEKAWAQPEHQWALRTAYDRICVYGDAEIFDPRIHYPILRPHQQKIWFSGYVVAPMNLDRRQPVPSLRKRVLVTMGGGEDGERRIDTYLHALALTPADWDSHIVTGPLMREEHVRRFKRHVYSAGLSEQVRISRFIPNLPRLLQQSDAVVSMAGYNSCAEILQSRIPAILMPRQHPRKEQLIRAMRLEELGLARCLPGQNAAELRRTLETILTQRTKHSHYPPLDGLENVCALVNDLTCQQTPASQLSSRARFRAVTE